MSRPPPGKSLRPPLLPRPPRSDDPPAVLPRPPRAEDSISSPPPVFPRPALVRPDDSASSPPQVLPRPTARPIEDPSPVSSRTPRAESSPPLPVLPRPTTNRAEDSTNNPPPQPPVSAKHTASTLPSVPSKPTLPPATPRKPKAPQTSEYEKPQALPGNNHVHKPSPAPQQSPFRAQAGDPDNFGYCLQTARDCINKRHEEELKALESFRVYMHKRARADAEYAATLGKINSLTAREMAGIGTDCNIVQAWKGVLEAMDSIQKRLYYGSKQVEDALLKTIDQIIKDKRGAKRAYDCSRSRLDEEYRQSCNEVQNFRRDYRQMLQVTEVAKRKLEQTLQKPGVKPAEVEKLRVKFVLSAEKLHKCHNDYTLAVLNANTHLSHYHRSMLPFCLNTLQERMELTVSQWRVGMEEYGHTMDMSQVYQESFGKLFTTLQNINSSEEYANLIQENKSDCDVELFVFDTSLLQDYCSPKVEATKMSINNLTHENLKAELTKMEQRLEEYERQHTEKEKELEALKEQDPSNEEPDAEVLRAVQMSNLQAEMKLLDCKIQRDKTKVERVKEDLREVGENTPLFDPLGEGVLAAAEPNHAGGDKDRKQPSDSLANKLVTLFRSRAQVSNSNVAAETEGKGASPERTDDNDSETGSNYEEVPAETRVEDEGWFFANMERKEAEMKCKNPGDYLIRYSSKQNRYVLTVNWAGQGKHFVIQEACDEETKEIKYRLEAKSFNSVRELLDFHVSSQSPVTKGSGAILMKAIVKLDKWALKHSDVKMGKKLGKGAFGDVWEATLKGQQKVAVKTCRSTDDDILDKEKFLQEAEILKQYDHPNIVKLIGVSWDTEPVLIVMELMPGGSLLDYLRKKAGSMPKGKMLHMSIDACSGMEYLESKNCIHRDLAARNCLVGDSDVVKISDFGMSREQDDGIYTIHSGGSRQIPIKWTAPEALNCGTYTSASDVWSYGVLLWEIFSYGSAPYPGMSNPEAKNQVDNGYRMPPPQGCPKEVHGVMQHCWAYEPEDRPNFTGVLGMLKALEGSVR